MTDTEFDILDKFSLTDDESRGTQSRSAALPTAEIWDARLVSARLAEINGGKASDAQTTLAAKYQTMLNVGPTRKFQCVQSLPTLRDLTEGCPNFSEVVESIYRQVSLSQSGVGYPIIRPLLLLGPPGVGKTYFARQLAAILGVTFEHIDMASVSAGFVLSGNSAQWSEAQTGRIADALLTSGSANPVVLLDEVDKASSDGRYSPLKVLYSLLEPVSSEHFRDEYLQVDINARFVVWILTANEEADIPKPLLNRMDVFRIEAPSQADFEKMAISVFRSCRISSGAVQFAPDVDDTAIFRPLMGMPAREMRRTLESAMGYAHEDQRHALREDDVVRAATPMRRAKQQSMGFV